MGAPSTTAVAPATATVPADVPLIGHNMVAGEKPPLEPAAALAHTQDGAIAFAKFWIQTLDWGYATTSTAYARHYTDPICSTCAETLDTVDSWARANDRVVGGRIAISGESNLTSVSLNHGAEYALQVLTDVTGVEVVDSNGRYVNGDSPVAGRRLDIWTSWTDHGWKVVDFGGGV